MVVFVYDVEVFVLVSCIVWMVFFVLVVLGVVDVFGWLYDLCEVEVCMYVCIEYGC